MGVPLNTSFPADPVRYAASVPVEEYPFVPSNPAAVFQNPAPARNANVGVALNTSLPAESTRNAASLPTLA